MDVTGLAFLSRQHLMINTVGEKVWKEFVAGVAKRHAIFREPITQVTRIPVDQFLELNDEMLMRFYNNDPNAYWIFGEKSAEFALSNGPLKGVFKPKEYRRFYEFTPQVWKTYFLAGHVKAKVESDTTALLSEHELPVKHLYFELTVMGFVSGALKYLGALNSRHEKLKSQTKGDSEILYRFIAG
jgi:hypothetical protein